MYCPHMLDVGNIHHVKSYMCSTCLGVCIFPVNNMHKIRGRRRARPSTSSHFYSRGSLAKIKAKGRRARRPKSAKNLARFSGQNRGHRSANFLGQNRDPKSARFSGQKWDHRSANFLGQNRDQKSADFLGQNRDQKSADFLGQNRDQ